MTTGAFQRFLCAVALATSWAFSTPAQATVFDVGMDPPFTLPGLMVIDVPAGPPCFVAGGGIHGCNFIVDSLDFFDGFGNEWGLSGPQTPIGSLVDFNATNTLLLGIQTTVSGVTLIDGDRGCDGTSLSVALPTDGVTSAVVTFHCGGQANDTGHVTFIRQVPEPATLALLGLSLIGLVATRQRKPS